jgi:prepilin-type N-terminal cleavage/methylation domain-containing protein
MRGSEPSRGARPAGGFTLVELLVSSAVFSILFLAAYGSLKAAVDAQAAGTRRVDLQSDAMRALREIVGDLKQTGRVNLSPPADRVYPYLFTNGAATGYFVAHSHASPNNHAKPGTPADGASSEIVYVLPRDLDADGTRVNATTGAIEWGPEDWSLVLSPQPDGTNTLERRRNGLVTRVLARRVNRLVIEDYRSDPTLGTNQLRVRMYLIYDDGAAGHFTETSIAAIVNMRNFID